MSSVMKLSRNAGRLLLLQENEDGDTALELALRLQNTVVARVLETELQLVKRPEETKSQLVRPCPIYRHVLFGVLSLSFSLLSLF